MSNFVQSANGERKTLSTVRFRQMGVFLGSGSVQGSARENGEGLTLRIEESLTLMHRWGFAPSVDTLSKMLLGGIVEEDQLAPALLSSDRFRVVEGFVCLRGHESLLKESQERVASHERLNGEIQGVTSAFVRDLLLCCPFVEVVALSGSAASGGFSPGDDIDFDLVVNPGTKYTTYLLASLVGLRYSWRYRHWESGPLHTLPLLPKVTCVNVVWPSDQTRPFIRQDMAMAFELLRCQPLYGSGRFEELLQANRFLWEFFPQAYNRRWTDGSPFPSLNAMGRFLSLVGRIPRALRLLEIVSRGITWMLYHFVQGVRAKNPVAAARMEFLRRVKYPYELFQD